MCSRPTITGNGVRRTGLRLKLDAGEKSPACGGPPVKYPICPLCPLCPEYFFYIYSGQTLRRALKNWATFGNIIPNRYYERHKKPSSKYSGIVYTTMYIALSESRRLAWPAAADITNPLKKRARKPGGTVKYTPFQLVQYTPVQNTHSFTYNVYVI